MATKTIEKTACAKVLETKGSNPPCIMAYVDGDVWASFDEDAIAHRWEAQPGAVTLKLWSSWDRAPSADHTEVAMNREMADKAPFFELMLVLARHDELLGDIMSRGQVRLEVLDFDAVDWVGTSIGAEGLTAAIREASA